MSFDRAVAAEAGTAPPARILIVDDNGLSRLKIRKAVESLGHQGVEADGGETALRLLRQDRFDAVLLDIVMPGMDGFEVLRRLKEDPELRHIPVIMITALDDDIDNIVRAVGLGAEDYLPKNFELVLLSARLGASLERKRLHDAQQEYYGRIEKLISAAQVLEAGSYSPDDLDLDGPARRNDPLGRLAAVFRGLSQELYDRERRADLTVRTMRGMLYVLAAGALFGLAPALGRMAGALGGYSPLGIALWANMVAAITCLGVGVFRNGLPRLGWRDLPFLLVWALVLGSLHRYLTILIAGHVEASLIALVGSSRAFMVFSLAAIFGIEKPSLRRFAGLGIGFGAVAVVLMGGASGGGGGSFPWILAAVSLPVLVAVHTLLLERRPAALDSFETVGLMLALSSALLAPIALSTGSFIAPGELLGSIGPIVLVLGVSSGLALVLALNVVASAGGVFASQIGYAQMLAGIVWGMLLLDERLSVGAWAAIGLVIVGFWLVEPRRANEIFRARLDL